MSYYIAKTIDLPMDAAIDAVTEALKTEGFGVLTRIDIAATLKEKIDVDFHPYTILGACNPKLAHEALELEDKAGLMLPCNVVVQETGEGHSEVAAIDPVASMKAIDNPALHSAAAEVRQKLTRVIEAL